MRHHASGVRRRRGTQTAAPTHARRGASGDHRGLCAGAAVRASASARAHTLRQPSVSHVNTPGWANNAIDHFVLAKLEKNNLTPALSADTDDLWRRIHIDVTGLLPEAPVPGEPFSLTYPQLVDRLLSSPRFGAQWGRHWLELLAVLLANCLLSLVFF